MSRGSTFTLYRAYNKFKVDDAQKRKILAEYHDFNKTHDWGRSYMESDSITEEERIKALEERERKWTEDVPLILNIDFRAEYDFDCDKKCESVDEYRSMHYANYVIKDDGRYCDKLLEWDFTSSFDCLIDHYHLNYYNFRDNAVIITNETAKEMLTAVEYLLGGKWDDGLEISMNNPWIKIFADGNNCDSYWKYVNRHKRSPKDTYNFSENGISVTVSIPSATKTADKDDESYLAELSESNEQMEFYLRNTANALRALVESDNWSYGDDTELVLVYSAWG